MVRRFLVLWCARATSQQRTQAILRVPAPHPSYRERQKRLTDKGAKAAPSYSREDPVLLARS